MAAALVVLKELKLNGNYNMSLPSSNISLRMGNSSNHSVPNFMTFPKYHIEIIMTHSFDKVGIVFIST